MMGGQWLDRLIAQVPSDSQTKQHKAGVTQICVQPLIDCALNCLRAIEIGTVTTHVVSIIVYIDGDQ